MKKIAIVYLAYNNGSITDFCRFIESYKKYAAGIEHDLIVIFKDYCGVHDNLVELLPCKAHVYTEDFCGGYDLGSYRRIVKKTNYDYYLFLNTGSEIMCNNWLTRFFWPFHILTDIGITCCYMSNETFYREAILEESFGFRNFLKALVSQILFKPKPNPHVRTNAFMIGRKLFLSIWPRFFFNKLHCYIFESGKNSMYNRIRKRGFICQPIHVGLFDFGTMFRQGDQSNLVIFDNQCRRYQQASVEEKQFLSKLSA